MLLYVKCPFLSADLSFIRIPATYVFYIGFYHPKYPHISRQSLTMAAINFTRSKEVTSKRILMRQKRCRRKSSLFGTCGQHRYVPWNIYRIDNRASITVPVLVHLIQTYNQTLRNSNPNCIVIRQSVCILLTADISVLDRAAGRDGPRSMSECRCALSSWVQTSGSRRPCLHAAQTFRALLHRKSADGTVSQSVRALFI